MLQFISATSSVENSMLTQKTPVLESFQNSPLPSVRKIRDRLLKHPELLVPLSGKVLEILAQGTNRVLMTVIKL